MYSILKKLIKAKYYPSGAQARSKLDVCFAMNKITADQYEELTMLVNEIYGEPAIEA